MSLVLLRTQSDERLVALTRTGHERAFEAIVKRYRRPLLAACARMVPEARAEDVLQQALVSAWKALRRGDEVRDLRAWLFRIVRNAAVSDHRRAGHDPPELLETLIAAPSPQEEAERRTVVHETLEAVAGLPVRQREALLQIAVQGRSQDEVADELGVSCIAVRQLVHRARATLRAAASALVPFPLIAWLASAGAGAEPVSLRIAQLVAGAGGAGAGATLLKAGAVAGVAAAVSAPALVERHPPHALPAAARATATPTATTTPETAPPARRPTTAAGDRHPARGHRAAARGGAVSGASGGSGDQRRPAAGGGVKQIAARDETADDHQGSRGSGDTSSGGGDGQERRDASSGGDGHSGSSGDDSTAHHASGDDGGSGGNDVSAGDGQKVSTSDDGASAKEVSTAGGDGGLSGIRTESRDATEVVATATPDDSHRDESDH
jgi:RNA polymerase sigma factor (sigma-70 family)